MRASSSLFCLVVTAFGVAAQYIPVDKKPYSERYGEDVVIAPDYKDRPIPSSFDAIYKAPQTVVMNGKRLAETRNIVRKSKKYDEQLKYLVAQADSWLGQGPWTVTSKKEPPPNGTIFDYASQAPYWWPNPKTADGCPYVQRDGERNPEVDKYQDRLNLSRMFNSTYVLSLAWFYTGDKAYSIHASNILRTWFINPATAMNPNLLHAQIVPCLNDGRAIGIIDFSQEYTNVLDAVRILAMGAPGWSARDNEHFKDWNRSFFNWLTTSNFGKTEATAQNNHGTFANMQITAIALFIGEKKYARDLTKELFPKFLNSQVTANGSQPQELARTRSFHYSNFNLVALLRWGLIAENMNINAFGYKGPQGQTLLKAVDFLIPAALGGRDKWAYEDIEFVQYAATDNIHVAADKGLRSARKAMGKLAKGALGQLTTKKDREALNRLVPPPGGDIYVLRPAPQQLDSIAKL